MEVRYVRSKSSPGTVYTVVQNDDGSRSCNCPRWRFKPLGRDRFCKHIREFNQTPFDFRAAVEVAVDRAAKVDKRRSVRA